MSKTPATKSSMLPAKPTSPPAAAPLTAAPMVTTAPARIEHDLVLAALPHPILLLGPDDHVAYANQAAEVFVSASLAVLRRQKLSQVVAFGSPLLSLIEQVRRSDATVNEYGVEILIPRVDGVKLVDVYAGPGPAPGHVLLMLQQRSMAQMIERQLTHRASARSVSGMAAVLAHEIKNPLSGIRGAAQLLEPGLSDDDRSLTQLICTETDRIRDLVDQLEVFGDERPMPRLPVNIHDVLDHVQKISESGFGRGIRHHADYDPSLPAVTGDRDKLIQAFLNLIKNAAEAISDAAGGTSGKAGEAGGRIILQTAFKPGVRLSIPGSGARVALPLMIQIEDNGPGVPDAMKSVLFDPFVTTKRTGSGLGLSLVAKIIGDHGGIIECDSEPRRTIFRILLPMHSLGSTHPRPGPSNPGPLHPGKG
jgi:two-component system, NtrC family, nitrogen regulation sensor histidine kinase GlnL